MYIGDLYRLHYRDLHDNFSLDAGQKKKKEIVYLYTCAYNELHFPHMESHTIKQGDDHIPITWRAQT